MPKTTASTRRRKDVVEKENVAKSQDSLSRHRRKDGPRKNITEAQLVARFEKIAAGMSNAPQGQGSDEMAEAMRAATDDMLSQHPGQKARLWAAICVAEGLRVFAPKPPLTTEQLQIALGLFVDQVHALSEPDRADNDLYDLRVGLLERVCKVRAFVLLFGFDNDSADELLSGLTAACLRVACRRVGEQDGNFFLETLLARLLGGVLNEADRFPRGVLQALLGALVQSPEEVPAKDGGASARGLARRIFVLLGDRFAVDINDYFNAELYTQRPTQTQGRGQLSSTELMHAIVKLYMVTPTNVHRVLTNIQNDLQSRDVERRKFCTETVGQILSHVSHDASVPLLGIQQPLLLQRFLDRLKDTDDSVRLSALNGVLALATAAAQISESSIENRHGNGAKAITESNESITESVRKALAERCLDPNDGVRLRAVEVAAAIAINSIAGVQLLLPVLPVIFRRIFDKNTNLRQVCADLAAKVYSQHYATWKGATDYRRSSGNMFGWVPQLLCEAYSVFVRGRTGFTGQLEALIEHHILGCGEDVDARQRGQRFVDFHDAVASDPSALKGFILILTRKREANATLFRHAQLKISQFAPVCDHQATSSALVPPSDSIVDAQSAQACEEPSVIVEALARLSPEADDRHARMEDLLASLRRLDALRDYDVWLQLGKLCGPKIHETTESLTSCLVDLEQLLHSHQLEKIAPLVRRALLKTWLLPDQVLALLDGWGCKTSTLNTDDTQLGSCRFMVELSRRLPSVFIPCLPDITHQLGSSNGEESLAALRVLSTLGRYTSAQHDVKDIEFLDSLEVPWLCKMLECAIRISARTVNDAASSCRKAVRAVHLLPKSHQSLCLEHLLMRSSELHSEDPTLAFCMAAACLQVMTKGGACSDSMERFAATSCWTKRAFDTLGKHSAVSKKARCAALEVCTSVSTNDDFAQSYLAATRVFGGQVASDPDLVLHGVASTLRALRHGFVPFTSSLLTTLASQVHCVFSTGKCEKGIGILIEAMRKLQKTSSTEVSMSDHLRLRTTLPTLIAATPNKKHRNECQHFLQSSFLHLIQHTSTGLENLFEFVVASFIHFLSRLDPFLLEANAAASAYPESTKIAEFFSSALLRVDAAKSQLCKDIALRICDRVQHFCDVERPTSDAVQKAAYVIRHVVERTCSKLATNSGHSTSAVRGGMPAELFALRQKAGANEPALPLTQAGGNEQTRAGHAAMPAVATLDAPPLEMDQVDAGEEVPTEGPLSLLPRLRCEASVIRQMEAPFSAPLVAHRRDRLESKHVQLQGDNSHPGLKYSSLRDRPSLLSRCAAHEDEEMLSVQIVNANDPNPMEIAQESVRAQVTEPDGRMDDQVSARAAERMCGNTNAAAAVATTRAIGSQRVVAVSADTSDNGEDFTEQDVGSKRQRLTLLN